VFPTLPWAHAHAAGPQRTNDNLVYQGGDVIQAPKAYLVMWGWHTLGPVPLLFDPSNEGPYLSAFFGGIGGTPYANIQTQYYSDSQGHITNPSAQRGGVWYDDTDPITPSATSGIALDVAGGAVVVGYDIPMQLEAKAAEQHFGDPSGVYIILTPHGFNDVLFGAVYCGWHATTNPLVTGIPIAFADIGYNTDAPLGACGENFVNGGLAGTNDGASIIAGHEYAEAITDPVVGLGWVDGNGQETGDKCAWDGGPGAKAQDVTWTSGTFAVQSLWSNAAGDCEVKYP
jgi:serine protease